MTFSILSYAVWYRTWRMHIKELIAANDFSGAQTLLQNLITEFQAKMPNDHSILQSELRHMQHTLKHLLGYNPVDDNTTYGKSKLLKIISYEPFQSQE